MLLGIGNYKGGTAKTTTAVHLATFLQKLGPTLLIDGDGIRSATKWSQRGTGHGLPFKVEMKDLDQLDQFRREDAGQWMHAFSEILTAPPEVAILRVDDPAG